MLRMPSTSSRYVAAGALSAASLAGVAAQITEDAFLHYAGLASAFGLVLATIYFLVRRAMPPAKTSNTDLLTVLLDKIAVLDRRIEELEQELKATKAEREELIQNAREHSRLRREIEMENLSETKLQSSLLVVVGTDAKLKVDLASLRAVRTDTGMEIRTVEDATLKDMKRILDRGRINSRPYDKVHLSVHSGPEGIYLSGEIVDAVRLSEILEGVRVLVIAGCESDIVGDYLGVVKHVVTMTEKVEHDDAALFTRAFWTEIGRGREPEDALRLALVRSPSGMSEYVERHF